MPTTTNYGWTTPADTDLVKDGAAAIRTLGSSIDSTLKTQIDNTVAAAIAKTIVDAKGDLIAATAADTVSRLAVGTNDQVLVADSTAATGLKWATPASGGLTQIATGSFPTGSATLTISSIPQTYKNLYLKIQSVTNATGGDYLSMRLNGVTSAVYSTTFGNFAQTTLQANSGSAIRAAYIDTISGSTFDNAFWFYTFPFYTETGLLKNVSWTGSSEIAPFGWAWDGTNTAAITSITFFNTGPYNYNGGTYTLYGAN